MKVSAIIFNLAGWVALVIAIMGNDRAWLASALCFGAAFVLFAESLKRGYMKCPECGGTLFTWEYGKLKCKRDGRADAEHKHF